MNAYERLMRRKQHGEKLEMKQVTYEVLHELWWDDDCSDAAIAGLFDVAKKKITNLRFKWGMKVPETIVSKMESQWDGAMPTIEVDRRDAHVSQEASVLLRKLNGLNDGDLESLRVMLARRFPAFAEVKQEIDFLNAVERVVRQFGVRGGV